MTQLISTNPAKNYQPVGSVAISTEKEIKSKVDQARKALKQWQEIGVAGRVKFLTKAMNEFKKNQEEMAKTISQEMGMAITASRDEIGWDFDYWQWYLENAEKALGDEVIFEDKNTIHKQIYEPIGVVGAIAPGIYPLIYLSGQWYRIYWPGTQLFLKLPKNVLYPANYLRKLWAR